MREKLILLFVSLSLFFAVGVEASDKYRVAVIIPLSGPVASLGTYARKAIELAYSKFDQKTKNSIELVFEDDQFDAKKTLAAYHRVNGQAKLDAVLVIGSPTAIVLSPETERNKQILISIGGSDPNISKDKRYSFIHWVIPPVLGQRLAQELIRKGFQRIAFVTSETTGCQADTDAAVSALQDLGEGSRIAYNQSFNKSETDYKATITTLKSKKVDAVVLTLMPGALSSFAKQRKQLGLEAELIGMETFEDESEVKAATGALDGAWYVNASDPTEEFSATYKSYYKELPGWASGNAFDVLNLLATAISQNSTDVDDVRRFLAELKDYSGAVGKYSASGDNRFLLSAALKQVTPSGFVTIAR